MMNCLTLLLLYEFPTANLVPWHWNGKYVGAHPSTLFMLGWWLCLGSNHVFKILERSRMWAVRQGTRKDSWIYNWKLTSRLGRAAAVHKKCWQLTFKKTKIKLRKARVWWKTLKTKSGDICGQRQCISLWFSLPLIAELKMPKREHLSTYDKL